MKRTNEKKALTALTLTLAVLTTHIRACGEEGAVSCSSSGTTFCYKRPLIDGKCGAPNPDLHCDFSSNEGCIVCSDGWARKDFSCVQGIPSDSYGAIPCAQEGQSSKTGKIFCATCNGGFPTIDQLNCQAPDAIFDAIPNCDWGRRNPDDGKTSCFKCDDGYTLDQADHTCKPWKIVGCWAGYITAFGARCDLCNPWLGYLYTNEKMDVCSTTPLSSPRMLIN